ncbi:MAG: thiamine pyrophosphate-binding protein [Alphaproteobacteria bacterium]|nr:thiamine pyrophosphate-binding protein [Alphaproteobacteria bacterium]
MNPKGKGAAAAEALAPRFKLDRTKVVPALVGRAEDFWIVSGLAGAFWEMAAMTNNGANYYGLGGAMGAACMMGLGLALTRPEKKILVVTGDGELLMSLGSLATIGTINPPNLSILCVDNGHYGETGYQRSHTSLGVDIEKFAQGAGIKMTCTVASEADIPNGARMLREGNATAFVLASVHPADGLKVKASLDGAACRLRFRDAMLAASKPQ